MDSFHFCITDLGTRFRWCCILCCQRAVPHKVFLVCPHGHKSSALQEQREEFWWAWHRVGKYGGYEM